MRTDTHSPKNFDPADYSYAYMIDLNPSRTLDPAYMEESRKLVNQFLEGPRPADPHKGLGECEHCGAHFLYGAIFHHAPTRTFIQVGNTCADEAFGNDSRRSYDLKKARERAAASRYRAKVRKHAIRFLEGLPEVAAVFGAFHDRHDILADMFDRLNQYGQLSPKQCAFAVKLGLQLAAELINPDAGVVPPCECCGAVGHEIENCPNRTPAPEGRHEFELDLVHTRWQDNDYGGTLKGLYVHRSGWKAWGSVPSGAGSVRKGSTLRLRATFEPSGNDPHFCFIKRPLLRNTSEELEGME